LSIISFPGIPSFFITEASIDLSYDKDRLDLKVIAVFAKIFVDIETLEESCLMLCNKLSSFPLAVTYSIYGYHFRRVFRDVI
jgi:hypothetical protein